LGHPVNVDKTKTMVFERMMLEGAYSKWNSVSKRRELCVTSATNLHGMTIGVVRGVEGGEHF